MNALVPGIGWQTLVLVCSAVSAFGGVLSLVMLRPGPHLTIPPKRQHREGDGWREVLRSITGNRELLCAIAAYSGHNWELYGMW